MSAQPQSVTGKTPMSVGPFDRVAGFPPALLLGVALAFFLILSLAGPIQESPTFDEGAYLAAGLTYLRIADYGMMPEHPPLSKVLAALPLVAFSPQLPENPELWERRAVYEYGFRFMYQSGNNPDRILFWGRIPTLLWSCLLIASAFAVARGVHGPRGGLIALGVTAFNPVLLAHGHLATSDVLVAALSFIALYVFWKTWHNPTPLRGAGIGVLVGGALLTKHSAALLFAIFLAMAYVFYRRDRAARAREVPAGRPPPPDPLRRRRLASLGLAAGLVYFLLWAGYGFRFSASADAQASLPRDLNLQDETLIGRAGKIALDHRLLPEAYVSGFLSQVRHNHNGHKTYALGHYSENGWWWYFPFALLVKTPLPTLLLAGWGLAGFARRLRGRSCPDGPFALAAFAYLAIAVSSRLNLGERYLLPILPCVAVLAAGLPFASADPRVERRKTWVAGGLMAGAALGCAASAPYFIPYFNLPSRLIFERHEMLADSSLDWGQDLGRLKRYMDRHGIADVKLAYFGTASPRHLGLRHQVLPGASWFSHYVFHEKEWPHVKGVGPGDWVAVSVNRYLGVYAPRYTREFYSNLLGGLRPVARIGHSIFLYRIPERRTAGTSVSFPLQPRDESFASRDAGEFR